MATATKFIQSLRNFLAGQNLISAQRYAEKVSLEVMEISIRSPEPPCLPDGFAHRLSANYYCSRDLRRAAAPPVVVYTSQKLIKSGDTTDTKPDTAEPIAPGPVYVPPP